MILSKLEQGLDSQRIFQDLVEEHGFKEKYWSVHRFVKSLGVSTELPFRRIEVEPGLPAIDADRDAMIEVLINLISNAIKYSPNEKKITVTAKRDRQQVAISVSDRGMGIAKNEHKRIFEKF